jgi:murein DD-endopeptidase MepM/ murein hydrolase activator NlpD
MNGLRDPAAVAAGQRLVVPGPRRAPPDHALLPPAGVRAAQDSPLERPRSQFRGLGDLRPGAVARWRARRSARSAGLDFAWPLSGAVSSGFGRRSGRLHEGIDVLGEPGALIRAAEAGHVVHSGPLGSYGNLVVVRHAGRFATAYAHAQRTLVRRGTRVRRGEPVAEVGATGNASGPHLHFEIRRSEQPLDPLLFLPDEP